MKQMGNTELEFVLLRHGVGGFFDELDDFTEHFLHPVPVLLRPIEEAMVGVGCVPGIKGKARTSRSLVL